ncbi:hypothetical protein D3C73_1063060 [compost metagenome]
MTGITGHSGVYPNICLRIRRAASGGGGISRLLAAGPQLGRSLGIQRTASARLGRIAGCRITAEQRRQEAFHAAVRVTTSLCAAGWLTATGCLRVRCFLRCHITTGRLRSRCALRCSITSGCLRYRYTLRCSVNAGCLRLS